MKIISQTKRHLFRIKHWRVRKNPKHHQNLKNQ
ncbi:unnamed protein product [Schistosoma curassoni]|uniref:Ribosomal protein L32 n=1 Tax=Schistosoma curassoni TaxID=6186 RepID=A0A183KHX3_9TREM|nr:unnamed protein product [Schistosoma curassoni]